MLMLRLSRFGKKKQPIYRLVIARKEAPVKGQYIEAVGHYNPQTKKLEANVERIMHWLSLGVQPSDTVHNLLYQLKLVKEKIKKTVEPKKKKKKEAEKLAPEKPPVIEAPKRKDTTEGSLMEEGVEEKIKEEEGKKEKAEKIMEAAQEQKAQEKATDEEKK